MVSVRKMIINQEKFETKCPYPMQAETITIHNTGNDASAENERNNVNRIDNNAEVSFHYSVDDIGVVQLVEENRNTWHAGDGGNGEGNRKSISIEICYSKSGGARFDKAEENAAEFVASILKRKGWGIDRVRKHQDWSGKYCPARTMDKGWQRFLNMIQANMVTPTQTVEYEAHVQNIGWQGTKRNGETAGTIGQSKRLEALRINCLGIKFKGHVQNIGWTSERVSGEIIGTAGEDLRLEAIQLFKDGIKYRVHVQNKGWTNWCKSGEVAGTVGESLRIEAVEINF